MGITQFIDYLRLRKQPEDSGAAPSAPPATKPPATMPSPDGPNVGSARSAEQTAFKDALAGIFAAHASALAGRVQFLGLDAIKAGIGDRWPSAKDRIHATARRVIQENLAPSDVSALYDDTNFVIVFATLDEAAAAVKCAIISDQIHAALLGDQGVDGVSVQAAAALIDRAQVDGASSAAETVATVANAISTAPKLAPSTGAAPNPACASPYADAPRPALPPAVPRPAQSAPRPVPTSADRPPQDDVRFVKSADQPPPSADPCPPPVCAPSPQAKAEPIDDFAFLPVWNIKREAVSIYYCMPRRKTARTVKLGYDTIVGAPSETKIATVDLLVLKHAIEVVSRHLGDDQRFLVLVPVHIETIATPQWRKRYLAMCEYIDADLKQHIGVEVVRSTTTTPESRHSEVAAILRPFFRYVLLRLDPPILKSDPPLPARFDGHGLDLSRDWSNVDTIETIRDFADRVRQINSNGYLFGLRYLHVVRAAIAMDYNYIAGPAILEPTELPQHAHPLTKSQLMGTILNRASAEG